jgi:hypothetical protein
MGLDNTFSFSCCLDILFRGGRSNYVTSRCPGSADRVYPLPQDDLSGARCTTCDVRRRWTADSPQYRPAARERARDGSWSIFLGFFL